MADINLNCKDCGKSFIFSERDQEFFASKSFSNPVRCSECRRIVKQRKQEQGGYQGDRNRNDRNNRY